MRNCPNCGAPMDPYKVKCDYCGTMYFDIGAWLQNNKPCYINYKFDNIQDYNGAFTALAVPKLGSVEITSDNHDIYSPSGTLLYKRLSSKSCTFDINFTCIPQKKTLFTITKED